MGGNFRIRVMENIGKYSESSFGETGTEHNLENGCFIDLEGDKWSNDCKLFCNIDEVNQYFNECDFYETKFELVEEE